jgi:hypothetical protein
MLADPLGQGKFAVNEMVVPRLDAECQTEVRDHLRALAYDCSNTSLHIEAPLFEERVSDVK